jgi:hypothetical protein
MRNKVRKLKVSHVHTRTFAIEMDGWYRTKLTRHDWVRQFKLRLARACRTPSSHRRGVVVVRSPGPLRVQTGAQQAEGVVPGGGLQAAHPSVSPGTGHHPEEDPAARTWVLIRAESVSLGWTRSIPVELYPTKEV